MVYIDDLATFQTSLAMLMLYRELGSSNTSNNHLFSYSNKYKNASN